MRPRTRQRPEGGAADLGEDLEFCRHGHSNCPLTRFGLSEQQGERSDFSSKTGRVSVGSASAGTSCVYRLIERG